MWFCPSLSGLQFFKATHPVSPCCRRRQASYQNSVTYFGVQPSPSEIDCVWQVVVCPLGFALSGIQGDCHFKTMNCLFGAFSLKGVGRLSIKTLLEWLAGPCSSSKSLTQSKGSRGEVDAERRGCLPPWSLLPCELNEEAEVFGKCTFTVSAGPWLHRSLSHGVSRSCYFHDEHTRCSILLPPLLTTYQPCNISTSTMKCTDLSLQPPLECPSLIHFVPTGSHWDLSSITLPRIRELCTRPFLQAL